MQLVRLMMPIMSRPTGQSHIITAYFGDKFGLKDPNHESHE